MQLSLVILSDSCIYYFIILKTFVIIIRYKCFMNDFKVFSYLKIILEFMFLIVLFYTKFIYNGFREK